MSFKDFFHPPQCVCVCVCVCVSRSVVSNSLRPHGLQPARLLSLWNSPGKNTGVNCHSLLQRNFPTQGSKPSLLHHRQILYHLSYREVHDPYMATNGILEEDFLPLNGYENPGPSPSCLIPWLQWQGREVDEGFVINIYLIFVSRSWHTAPKALRISEVMTDCFV